MFSRGVWTFCDVLLLVLSSSILCDSSTFTMPKCFVKNCKQSDKKHAEGVTFHKIPFKKRSEWLRAIRQPETIFISYHRICSLHFNKGDFENISSRKILKPGTIPSKNLPTENPLASSLPEKETLTEEWVVVSLGSLVKETDVSCIQSSSSALRTYIEVTPNQSSAIKTVSMKSPESSPTKSGERRWFRGLLVQQGQTPAGDVSSLDDVQGAAGTSREFKNVENISFTDSQLNQVPVHLCTTLTASETESATQSKRVLKTKRFPFNRPVILKPLIKGVTRQDWNSSKYIKLRRGQSLEENYKVVGGNKVLKEDAVPSVFNRFKIEHNEVAIKDLRSTAIESCLKDHNYTQTPWSCTGSSNLSDTIASEVGYNEVKDEIDIEEEQLLLDFNVKNETINDTNIASSHTNGSKYLFRIIKTEVEFNEVKIEEEEEAQTFAKIESPVADFNTISEICSNDLVTGSSSQTNGSSNSSDTIASEVGYNEVKDEMDIEEEQLLLDFNVKNETINDTDIASLHTNGNKDLFRIIKTEVEFNEVKIEEKDQTFVKVESPVADFNTISEISSNDLVTLSSSQANVTEDLLTFIKTEVKDEILEEVSIKEEL